MNAIWALVLFEENYYFKALIVTIHASHERMYQMLFFCSFYILLSNYRKGNISLSVKISLIVSTPIIGRTCTLTLKKMHISSNAFCLPIGDKIECIKVNGN